MVPTTKIKYYVDRDFIKATPTLLNQRPLHLRQISALGEFKHAVKTHVLKVSFYHTFVLYYVFDLTLLWCILCILLSHSYVLLVSTYVMLLVSNCLKVFHNSHHYYTIIWSYNRCKNNNFEGLSCSTKIQLMQSSRNLTWSPLCGGKMLHII